MKHLRLATVIALSATLTVIAADPKLPGIGTAMQSMIDKNEIAGAVTMVVSKSDVLHLETTGFADVASKRPMAPDTLFWIASMTKPVTGVAVLMLQDEGKLHVADPVAKYLPEFANLKTPSGKPANLTITQILAPLRNVLPPLGGFDLSPLVAWFLLSIVQRVVMSAF